VKKNAVHIQRYPLPRICNKSTSKGYPEVDISYIQRYLLLWISYITYVFLLFGYANLW
jgi:hypothetical protein